MSAPARPRLTRNALRWLVLLGVALAGVLALQAGLPARLREILQAVLDWISHLGGWAPVVFVLVFILLCVLVMPGSPLTFGAGAIFGFWHGAALVSVGATLGATAAFLVSRHLARGWVTRRFGAHPVFRALDQAVASEGWRIVFLTRLAPVFPFFLINHLYGLTRVPLRQYVPATWAGSLPGSTLLVYLGHVARQGAEGGAAKTDWLRWGFFLVTGFATMIYLASVARRQLAERLQADPASSRTPSSSSGVSQIT
ncbi:MAG: hypothetical protein RJA22_1782 [Verrucomicrobiota bacterium]|jgi:uncharacterized membrane protein YdjX (TVP38/TMEM64 family)